MTKMDLQKLNTILLEMQKSNQLQAEVNGIKMKITPTNFHGKISTAMFGA